MIAIRLEKAEDASRIRQVNELAFGEPTEAILVDRLRQSCSEALSLVAEDDFVVGHILFTPVEVDRAGRRFRGMGLAPMAVVPDRQREGIGTQLVREGLRVLRERACPYVVVIGHPEYYPRFGFESASARGLSCQWEGVPEEAFMILVLDAEAMNGAAGVVRYRDEFSEVA